MRAAWLVAAIAAAPAGAQQELPVYPGTVHTRVGDDLIINGEHFRIAYFSTRDSLAQVADYFFQQWKRRGLPTTADGDFQTEIVVSAFYTREGVQRSVLLRSQQGKTVGFAVLRDLWLSAWPPPEMEPIAVEGTLFSQSLLMRGDGEGTRHQSALLELDLPRASMQVRQQLGSRGFTLMREAPATTSGGRSITLEHATGKQRVHTVLTTVDAGLTAMVQTWASDLPPATSSPAAEPSGRRGQWR
ncbi:MAG TPA: hypothetical protein VKE49_08810 [Myxococcaceae bacterium]|nr:hypothetical protein [Myxococcaceae bacterium]